MARATSAREPARLRSLEGYVFKQGHPSKETARQAYDDADLHRAISGSRSRLVPRATKAK